jgi:plasmid stability protein
MANLTLAIDDKLLQAARIRAVKDGTSVNDICRAAIENYARAEGRHDWLSRYDEITTRIAAARKARAARPVQRQSREQMYDEILDERMPGFLGGKRPRA